MEPISHTSRSPRRSLSSIFRRCTRPDVRQSRRRVVASAPAVSKPPVGVLAGRLDVTSAAVRWVRPAARASDETNATILSNAFSTRRCKRPGRAKAHDRRATQTSHRDKESSAAHGRSAVAYVSAKGKAESMAASTSQERAGGRTLEARNEEGRGRRRGRRKSAAAVRGNHDRAVQSSPVQSSPAGWFCCQTVRL
jgi:hypothetical protein